MDSEIRKQIELHTKGDTVRHKSPFESLDYYDNGFELTQEFIDKWVIPFYMVPIRDKESFINQLHPVKRELNSDIIKQLLGDFNWRTRSTGARFASLLNLTEVEDIIGIHLLKSQVCYAGDSYCLALASFNNSNSIFYLEKYLEYYLQRTDLYFDQSSAMAALIWLDNKNKTDNAKKLQPLWDKFVKDKPNWDLNKTFEHFSKTIELVESIKNNW